MGEGNKINRRVNLGRDALDRTQMGPLVMGQDISQRLDTTPGCQSGKR